MLAVLHESIGYWITPNAEAVIQSCSDSIETPLPRNCLAFCGDRIRVSHLETDAIPTYAKIFVIPHSIHTVVGVGEIELSELKYLVF
jgi:hypothetical protein